jgi:transposase
MANLITLKNHLSKKQLHRKYIACQHPQEKLRWHALALIAGGEVANTVAKNLGRSSAWITKTVRRYNEGGVEGVKNKSKNQASKTLTPEQIKELENEIESGKTNGEGLWTSRQIQNWVKDRTGKEIHKTTAWRMFAKLEFSQQVPRPAHRSKASEEEQRDFKKT